MKQIDLSAWDGQAGQVIRLRALDDVKVTGVEVVNSNTQGQVLEQGPAEVVDTAWWTYITTTQII